MDAADLTQAPDLGSSSVDGRVARRQRNQDAVLDVVLEMFAEDMIFPTIEQAAKRSGLSLRSLYRYFADPGELVEAAIRRNQERNADRAHLVQIGRGPLADRIADLVAVRVRVYAEVGAVYRATVHNAAHHQRVAEALHESRLKVRDQFERQFASELDVLDPQRRVAITDAGDALTQLDTIDLLHRYRDLPLDEVAAVLRAGLTALLSA
ncbi:MAG TPA: TetR/AcrR family transcriptional regulator [Ilumatobacter sp.]|nr:TetR/AcrR family transcriptional regulator [Ilumatobacter sp.]